MCDGRRVAGVAGRLHSSVHVEEFEATQAVSQHQQALLGREGTTGEIAVISRTLVENRHLTKPTKRKPT